MRIYRFLCVIPPSIRLFLLRFFPMISEENMLLPHLSQSVAKSIIKLLAYVIFLEISNIFIKQAPFQLLEMLTIATFEYLYRLNRNRLQKTTYNLSERYLLRTENRIAIRRHFRYQIAENIRVLEILRPIAKL